MNKANQPISNHCLIIKLTILLCLLYIPLGKVGAQATDSIGWNQFRGGERNGRVVLPDAKFHWLEPEPALLWSKETGSGFSEVTAVDNRLYLLMAETLDSLTGWEFLVCLDAANGDELWRTVIDTIFIDADDWGHGPRSTPAVDHDQVFCFSGSGKLIALGRTDGAIHWSVSFPTTFGSTLPRWGYSGSPLLVDDMVMMEVGGENQLGYAAFCKSTGDLKWHAGKVQAGYNSPIVANIDHQTQIIFVSSTQLHAYNPSGDSLWSYNMPLRSPMALPLFIPPNKLFVSAANDAGSFIIEINDNEPQTTMESARIRNDWSSSCYKEGFLYGFNVATLVCMDAETGERKWLRRGFGKGSLIMVHDRLFILSDTGTLSIAKATPEGYIEKASVEALHGRSWTAPSYANGKLFVRNHTHIACFQILSNTLAEEEL